MAPTVRAAIDAFEVAQMAAVPEVDAIAKTKYDQALAATGSRSSKKAEQKADFSEVYKYLTDYSVNTAQGIFNEWVNLEVFLLLKYMDGNVKGQNPDGSFITNGYSDRIPGAISNPGYTDKWKEAVVRDHGEVLEVK